MPSTMTSTTEELQEIPEGARRGSAALRFGLAFLVGLGLVVALVAGAAYAFERQYAGRILPGVRVGTVDLSGLTPAEAAAALAARYATLGAGRIVVAGPDDDATMTFADAGRRLDSGALIRDALAAGRAGSPVDRLVVEIRTMIRGTTIAPRVVFDRTAVEQRVDDLARALDRAPVDAAVRRVGDTFTSTAAAPGRAVDGAAAIAALGTSLAALDAPTDVRVELDVAVAEPSVTNAEAALARAQAMRMDGDVVLGVDAERWTIPAATVRGWIGFAATPDGRYAPTVDRALAQEGVAPLSKTIDRAPVDATFLVGKGDQVVGVKPGLDGRTLDVPATTDLVAAAVAARATLGSGAPLVTPVLSIVKPAVTTEMATTAAPLMTEISRWTTYYPIYEGNGFGVNIEIPARLIDGTIVPPGGVFDFWKVVGEVTQAKGYRQGGAIIDGHTEPQGALAGGICSCSTTIFNAGLRAGLSMGARLNHYYYIDRYPLGLDATVFISASGAVQTMSWTNDTAYPILIRGSTWHVGGRGYVRFQLFSVPTGRTVSFTTPIVKNRRAATTVTQDAPDLPVGRRKQIEYPVEGKDVWVTRTVTDASGAVIHRETYYSHYSTITGIILVGTGGVTTSPSPSPSAAPSPSPSPAPSPTPSPAP